MLLVTATLLSQPLIARDRWKLVWHDEFDGVSLATDKWTYVVGGNGFGNDELEYYTDRRQNVYVQNGNLILNALKESYTGPDGVSREYTSGRIRTKGKFSQAYGRFEARVKIPRGQGIWPAFWMLGDNGERWPDCGEIDIMENIGREPDTIHGTVHGPGYSGSKGIGTPYKLPNGAAFSADFHIYAVEWTRQSIQWYVDDALYKTLTPADLPVGTRWVYDHPFFLILNVAVGGRWPGSPDQTTSFPQKMYVDYVRVYQAE